MPYELTNRLRGPSTLRVVDGATPNLTLSSFSANVGTENINRVIITSVKWSVQPTAGSLTISRDGVTVLNVAQAGFWSHDELAIANNATANMVVTITNGGTCLIGLKKDATYNVDVQKL
jgi:hypothetical protein